MNETPRWLFEALDREFHFVLDAAASDDNHLCTTYFTERDNALQQDWWPYRRVWCNPPYDTIGKRNLIRWVAKGDVEGKRCLVAMLLPSKTDTIWWHKYAAKGEIRWVKGRLQFGEHSGKAPWASVVVIFSTWRFIVRSLMTALGGKAKLVDLYRAAEALKNSANNFVPAKIRQTVQRYPEFSSPTRGTWEMA